MGEMRRFLKEEKYLLSALIVGGIGVMLAVYFLGLENIKSNDSAGLLLLGAAMVAMYAAGILVAHARVHPKTKQKQIINQNQVAEQQIA